MMCRASVGKIIKNDYAAFLMTVSGPILCGLWGLITFVLMPRGWWAPDPELVTGLGIGAAVVSFAFFAVLVLRVRRIKRVLATGPRVVATVADTWFVKDRGRVEFRYVFDGRQYRTGTAVMKCKETKGLAPGLEVEAAIDPRKPGRAYIVQLYSRTR